MHIKKVVIVGGGSSGWMTASALAKLCPHLDISLVESETTPTVGVGESTLGFINRFLQLLDLKDEEWMPACSATYKNSIQFTNFREGKGEVFQYPFVNGYDASFQSEAGLSTWSELSTLYPDEFPPETFAEFNALSNTMLVKHNRECKGDEQLFHFNYDTDTAYHMDAQKFGQYLKEKVAIPNGVKHYYGNITDYKDTKKGQIQTLYTSEGQAFGADLFIDCTGFQSLLLEKIMGALFVPFKDRLANDKAWAVRLPYTDRKNQMHNVTDCHALDNGWVWNIPLWDRIGTGYVYSSRFVTEQNALKEFKEHLRQHHDPEYIDDAKFFQVNIRHGKRTRAWVGNVVGIGLSYGFVEPLESTGLLTTHENVINLCELLNKRNGYVARTEREMFNKVCDDVIYNFRDFVSMHYAMSMRTDTPYWKWATQTNEYHPDLFNEFNPRWDDYNHAFIDLYRYQQYRAEYQGHNFIMAGMGIRSISSKQMIEANRRLAGLDGLGDVEIAKEKFLAKRKDVEEFVKTLPTHYEFLRDNIYGGNDEYDV